jgi:hypothetical protein
MNYQISFYDLLKENIQNDKFSLKISGEEVNCIHHLFLHYPEKGTKINKILDDIIDDGKLDLHDVPNIILFLSQIYKSHIIENEIQNMDVLHLVQITIDTLFDCGFLPLSKMEIDTIKKIADLSMQLLKTDVTIKKIEKEACCFIMGR